MPAKLCHPPRVWPLCLWLMIQMVSLSLSAIEVPFSAHSLHPPERLAIEQLLSVQIIAGALLAPLIFARGGMSLLAIASCLPLLLLAGWLAPEYSVGGLARSGFLLVVWLGLLALSVSVAEDLPRVCVRPAAQAVSALASLWSAGGVCLYYLMLEYPSQGPSYPQFTTIADFCKVVAAGPVIAAVQNTSLSSPIDLTEIFLFCVIAGVRILQNRMTRARLSTEG